MRNKMAAFKPPFFCPEYRQRFRSLGKSAHTDGPERSLFHLSVAAFPELPAYAHCPLECYRHKALHHLRQDRQRHDRSVSFYSGAIAAASRVARASYAITYDSHTEDCGSIVP